MSYPAYQLLGHYNADGVDFKTVPGVDLVTIRLVAAQKHIAVKDELTISE